MEETFRHREIFSALAAPLDGVRQRSQAGRTFDYVTARTVMNRLDDVLGPENWWAEYTASETGVLCRLSIRLPSGDVITKCDAGGFADMSDAGDNEKSGYSDGFKRAAVVFGVGRYLYGDGVPEFAASEHQQAPAKKRTSAPPATAAASRPAAAPRTSQPSTGRSEAKVPNMDRMPSSGKGLFAWAMQAKDSGCGDVMKIVSSIGTDMGFADRTNQWSSEEVAEAWEQLYRNFYGEESVKVVAGSSNEVVNDEDLPF